MLDAGAADADPAPADGAPLPSWTFGGYGTLGAVHSSEHEADFTANVLTPGSAGHSRSWSADVDSRVGMQLGVQLTPALSAVLQLVSERGLTDSWRPAVEWANLSYQVGPDLSVRVGRIALPLFLAGDYRKAGYALPWVRPPVELYDAIPISNSDGVDASYRWTLGGFNHVTQALFGRTDISIGALARARARRLASLSDTATSGALTVRASVLSTELTVDVATAYFNALRQFGPQGAALADRYGARAKNTWVASVGASYDPGAWFLMAEIGRAQSHSFFGDKTAGYLSGGYRYGILTPYATWSKVRANMPTRVPGLDLAGLPPPLVGAGAALNAGLNGLLSSVARQHTSTVGLRWDFHSNLALKLQYDRLTPEPGSTGTLINVQPGFQSGHAIGVSSAVIDFVF
ncbi:hypothetical protein [Rugamonas sp.]|uniref:hypothetical protein n=1 Tax=Rugamonas sp. TaxID=1926287 RepID=UPI0025F5E48D|nr:hypothetical protein [Rugamonas sp.]